MSKGINSENYFVVQGFMCNEMGLTGNELLVYAIIYGFSQDGYSRFRGGRSYLSQTLNISKPTVDKALKSLIDKGYVIKVDVSINEDCPYYEYLANLQVVKNLYAPSKETLQGGKEILLGGSKESLPSNIDIHTNKDKIGDNIDKPHKRFTPPTLEEVSAYISEQGYNIDPERFMDYYTSNGWKVGKNPMKDWKATIRTWVRNNYSTQRQTKPSDVKYVNPFDDENL